MYHSWLFSLHSGSETITALTLGKKAWSPSFLLRFGICNLPHPPSAQTKSIGITFLLAFLCPQLLPRPQASFHVYGAFLPKFGMSVIICHASRATCTSRDPQQHLPSSGSQCRVGTGTLLGHSNIRKQMQMKCQVASIPGSPFLGPTAPNYTVSFLDSTTFFSFFFPPFFLSFFLLFSLFSYLSQTE